ncbi:MAG: Spy/CpxP family protein refolding chaperone [Candidatus Omnitrophota bacterium]|nr:Spy/CpxP family protein refolding chaperone [Candidatus Omnitrophota bacterium]
MKNTVLKLSVILAVITVLCAAPAAYSQPSYGGDGPEGMNARRSEIFDKISERLDLSPKQREQLKELRRENREMMKALMEELRDTRHDLSEELQETYSSRKKIKRVVSDMKKLQAKQIDQRVDNFLDMKKILTPDQFEEFMELKEERKHHRRDHGRKSHWGRFRERF